MLQLTAEGQTLDIRNASFNLTLKSPLAGGTAGSFVFSVTIPYSINNARIFGFPFRLERLQKVNAAKEGYIIYNGLPAQEGLWQAKSSTHKNISIEMLIGSGAFSDFIEGKKLPELFDVGLSYTNIIDHVEAQVLKTWPEVNHNFPSIYNPKFYGDKNLQFAGILNNFESDFVQNTDNSNTIVPQLYLPYAIKRVFQTAGYSVKGSVFDDTMFKSGLLYSNFALDYLRSTFFYGEIYDTPIGLNTDYVIYWDTEIQDPGSHYTQTTGCYRVTNKGNYRTKLFINHQLETLLNAHADYYRVEVWYGDTMIKYWELPHPNDLDVHENNLTWDEVIDENSINDDLYVKIFYIDTGNSNKIWEARINEANCTIQNIDAPEVNEYLKDINYKNHVPAIDAKVFLNQFYLSAKILPFFDHHKKIVELVFMKDLLKSAKKPSMVNGLIKDSLKVYANSYAGLTFGFDFQGPDDLLNDNFIAIDPEITELATYADLPLVAPTGSKYYIRALNATFIRAYDEATDLYSWEDYNDRHSDYIIDDGQDDIRTQLAPLLMRCVQNSNLTNRNMPSISAEGSSAAFGMENEFPLRIMFWYGIEHAATANAYPLATTTKYSTDGSTILPINWTMIDIVARYWPEVIDWYRRREKIEFEHEVSPTFIKAFDFQAKYLFQNTLALFEEVVVKIKNNSFGPAKFKGWG